LRVHRSILYRLEKTVIARFQIGSDWRLTLR
jgi:hypothetical protein